jgi:multiple sugar transport system substrate-binding protein
MVSISRRGLIRTSLTAVSGALAMPYIARAEAKTAVCWLNQGFVPQEDEAMRAVCEAYMKTSGNKLDYGIMPFMALNQKTISALTSGDVPDLVFMDAPSSILPQNAWDDKLLDVSDVVSIYESQLTDTARAGSTFYNKAQKKRSYYLCPIKQGATPFHVWGDLVEKAGMKLSDAPTTWNAYWDFFKPMQKILRGKGMRRVYALGLVITTVGPNDGNNQFNHFLIANGGQGIVTPDGKLHTDDPRVREAAINTCTWMTEAFKDGYVPPEAMTWNDADDNNGFHEKLFIIDFDGTISTELAMIKNKAAYDAAVTMGLPKKNDGSPMPCQVNAGGGYIPKGARNVEVAKDFMKYFMQPEVMNQYLKSSLGRWVPAIGSIVKSDPWWLSDEDPHRKAYVTEASLGPTMPLFEGYSPAWGQANAEQLWGVAVADVIKNGMTPSQAIDKAFKRTEEIFARITYE